ncbi:MAG: alpha-amylase [Anaerolineales bacterium]|nr:alpha-amylase [Anaerolineales bacterium]
MLTARSARNQYALPLDFYDPDGHIHLKDLAAARRMADQISALRATPALATDLYALSLLDEAYHLILRHYSSRHSGIMARAMGSLQAALSSNYEATLVKFTEEFPPLAVFRGEQTAGVYLATQVPRFGDLSRGVRAATLEEILLIQNANRNPAVQSYRDLFDDAAMQGSAYPEFVEKLFAFFTSQPSLGGRATTEFEESLTELLLAPIRAHPDSIEGQLRFMIEKWGRILGEIFSTRVLRGLDFIQEEAKHRAGQQASVKGEAQVPIFHAQDYAEGQRFSLDQDWMPRLVLIAKNSHVWLHQLSKKYQYAIRTLDQIPDEELDLLAKRGFTGLWLIGLWERSRASQKIKQRMGQPEAVASAYSLFSYDIAADLGGWDALQNLRQRAIERGIRLSADMVPNHMGIDSTWVVEHPDWFLSLSSAPYPSYSFKSENLSDDLRVGIYLEDHYYDHSDAAVVFQRRDHQTGDLTYIYHGNDGTAFPWNDTAQLDYTKADVREAIIQTILHVARNFPIIRFDAAMTLAKKHIQRLWFPEPGAGGAIPSRAQFGLTKAEFDALVPHEFWREVVDRVAAEVPDTLLLAEAFWLMEGYFVRALGMHRVYNSAFMHMLRDEDNAKYRSAIKQTLKFDPQILKRYVNFMNNPDEKTAIEQFGNGDKYFGVCTLLATLPGLPMFGHGQIEGFTEKYGMEYRAPKLDERPDDGLLRGHAWRIFPLLHRRYLFADVERFTLFDLQTEYGVDENVFAYSNGFGEERGVTLYHNKFADTRGWVKEFASALALPRSGLVIFKDYVTHQEYIRSCRELHERGLYVELGAYQCAVFMDFRFVSGADWETLCKTLNGFSVPSMQKKWEELFGSEPINLGAKDALQPGKPKKKAVIKSKPVKKAVKRKTPSTGKKPVAKKPAAGKKEAAKPVAKPKPIKKKAAR